MSRKQRGNVGKGRPPGAPGERPPQGAPQKGPGAPQQGGWVQTRDSIRRDVQQAVAALGFAERTSHRLESQRRLYIDFPRVTEALRSGALERLSVALGRLYEDGRGQTVDVQRFLRDLPLATAHLAAKERAAAVAATASAPPPASSAKAATEGAPAADAAEASPPADATAAPEADAPAEAAAEPAPEAEAPAAAAEETDAAPAAEAAPAEAAPKVEEPAAAAEAAAPKADEPAAEAAGPAAPPSPRLELRSRLLAAAPQLAKAAASFRRNVATVRRACSPRRSPGPWRSDREVLEEASRAVEFAQKMYDAYAEAWADEPLEKGALEAVAAEVDRFLAWTQLDRYAEMASAARQQQKPAQAAPPSSPPPPEAAAESAPKEEPAAETPSAPPEPTA